MGLGQFVQEKLQRTSKKIEARRANARARYANLIPEQRQAVRDRQRLLHTNMAFEQKYTKKNGKKACLAIRRDTLSKNSIAMEDPLYNSSDSD
jgi:hypothetical protein